MNDVPAPDLEKESRAFEMLRWNPYSLPAEFDWELAGLGFYSRMQKERSDKALDALDAEIKANKRATNITQSSALSASWS